MHELADLPCLIAVHRHTPQGALYYTRDGADVVLVALATMPRRCGTGTAMIAALANTLRRDGVTEILTSIEPDNTVGKSFLESVGFIEQPGGEDGAGISYTLKLA